MKEFQIEVKMFGFTRKYKVSALSEREAQDVAIAMMSAELGID